MENLLTEPTLQSIYTNMEQFFFSPDFYRSASTVLLCIVILSTALLSRRKNSNLAAQLLKTQKNLAKTKTELKELQKKYQSTIAFQKNLNEAEITTRLQQPRLSVQHSDSIKTPERYQYVRSLAEGGMSAEDIASALSISTHEAKQLVNLSKLAAMAA